MVICRPPSRLLTAELWKCQAIGGGGVATNLTDSQSHFFFQNSNYMTTFPILKCFYQFAQQFWLVYSMILWIGYLNNLTNQDNSVTIKNLLQPLPHIWPHNIATIEHPPSIQIMVLTRPCTCLQTQETRSAHLKISRLKCQEDERGLENFISRHAAAHPRPWPIIWVHCSRYILCLAFH